MLASVPFKTCYQPSPADPTSEVVAHAVDNTNPNVSVAGETLLRDLSDDIWPGHGASPCHECEAALKLGRQTP